MAEPSRGLLDTPVVNDLHVIDPALLPDKSAISAVTLAELAAGPHTTPDAKEHARRQDRLQWTAATWDALPSDADAARMYGRTIQPRPAGRSIDRLHRRGPRLALLYTRKPDDLASLGQLATVEAV